MGNRGAFIVLKGKDMQPQYTTYEAVVSYTDVSLHIAYGDLFKTGTFPLDETCFLFTSSDSLAITVAVLVLCGFPRFYKVHTSIRILLCNCLVLFCFLHLFTFYNPSTIPFETPRVQCCQPSIIWVYTSIL
jgi:hypothetical protein